MQRIGTDLDDRRALLLIGGAGTKTHAGFENRLFEIDFLRAG